VGLESLRELDEHLAIRRELADSYRVALTGVAGITPQVVDPRDASTYKDFTVIVDESVYGLDRDTLASALKAEGVDTRPYFYPPVHRQDAYADLGTPDLPATDWVSDRVISLPLWRDMPASAIATITEVLAGFGAHADRIREAVGRDGAKGAPACVPS
jgi:dTDP-4-amino-4,6-dideoxygalactose transaminase